MTALRKKVSESMAAATVQASVSQNCRARPALSTMIEMSPGMAGLALWVDHVNGEKDEAPGGIPTTAWTDSKKIVYNPGFGKYRAEEQCGVVVHEISHVSFQHPTRGARMRRITPHFHAGLWNTACDAIINDAIKAQSGWCRLPASVIPGKTDSKPVYLSELLEQYKAWAEKNGKKEPNFPPLAGWAAEDVYHFLSKWRDESRKDLEKALNCKLEDLAESDLIAPPTDPNESPEERERRENGEFLEWRQRIIRAQAGDRPGGLLRALAGDIPRVDTPWEKILHTQIRKATEPKSQHTPTKPSRHWLGVTDSGRIGGFPYQQGIIYNPPGAKIAVLIDTSGSIGDDLLTRFAAEIDAIHKRTRAELYIVVCDAEVTYTQKIKAGGFGEAVKKIQFTGGGGTDFRPAIKKAAEFDPAIAVYLTDMMGAFPERKPPFRMVWACPLMGQAKPPEAPFGTVIGLR